MTLEIKDLTCLRGDRVVVEGFSALVPSGGALVLTGANGAGKTTLLRALAGLSPANSGQVRLDGKAQDRDPAAWSERIAWLGHAEPMKPHLSFAANLAAWAGILRQNRDLIPGALAHFGLGALAGTELRHASAGQRRRLALARLMLGPRRLWLLDEPATALDRQGLAALGLAIGLHRAAGGILVVATHQELGLPGAREIRLGEAA